MKLIAVLLLGALAFGAEVSEFEVASVKPVDTQKLSPMDMATRIAFGASIPNRIRYRALTLKVVLAYAYDVRLEQVAAPDWLDSERYAIEATIPPGTDANHLRTMFQKLVADRFQLRAHREIRNAAVYFLKVAKNGPKLQPSKTYATEEERRLAVQEHLKSLLRVDVAAMKAGNFSSHSTGGQDQTTPQIADNLSRYAERLVIDRTELPGKYSYLLSWDADISIFTALQDQLGLRLESGNEPVEFLVVDSADKVPSGN